MTRRMFVIQREYYRQDFVACGETLEEAHDLMVKCLDEYHDRLMGLGGFEEDQYRYYRNIDEADWTEIELGKVLSNGTVAS